MPRTTEIRPSASRMRSASRSDGLDTPNRSIRSGSWPSESPSESSPDTISRRSSSAICCGFSRSRARSILPSATTPFFARANAHGPPQRGTVAVSRSRRRSSAPRPVIIGRSRNVRMPGGAAQTCGMAWIGMHGGPEAALIVLVLAVHGDGRLQPIDGAPSMPTRQPRPVGQCGRLIRAEPVMCSTVMARRPAMMPL